MVNDFDTSTVFRYGPNGAFKKIFAAVARPNQIAIGPDDMTYVTNATFRQGQMILTGDLNVYNSAGMLVKNVQPSAFVRGVTVYAAK